MDSEITCMIPYDNFLIQKICVTAGLWEQYDCSLPFSTRPLAYLKRRYPQLMAAGSAFCWSLAYLTIDLASISPEYFPTLAQNGLHLAQPRTIFYPFSLYILLRSGYH